MLSSMFLVIFLIYVCVCVRTEATQRAVVYWFHATVALMVMPCQTRHHSNFQGSGSKTDNMIALLWWYVNQFPAQLKLIKILRLEQLNVINFYDFQGCNVFNNRVIPLSSQRQLMVLVRVYVAWGSVGPRQKITPTEVTNFWHWVFYFLAYDV